MENQKATSHPPLYQFSHFPQAVPISWNLLHSYQICKPLFPWAGNFASSQLSTTFPDPQASWAHKRTSSPAHMQNPGSSSSCIVAAQNDAANGCHSSVQFGPHRSAAGHRKGSADPLPLTGYSPPGKGWLQSKNWGRSQITWCQGMTQHQRHYRASQVCPWKADSCEALLCSRSTENQTVLASSHF